MSEVTGELDACAFCQRPHERAHLFCSASCERAYHAGQAFKRREELRQRTCHWCMRRFRASRADAVYCGPGCRQAAHRARHYCDGIGKVITAAEN